MTEETMTMTQPDTTGTTGNAPEGNEDIINAAQLMDEPMDEPDAQQDDTPPWAEDEPDDAYTDEEDYAAQDAEAPDGAEADGNDEGAQDAPDAPALPDAAQCRDALEALLEEGFTVEEIRAFSQDAASQAAIASGMSIPSAAVSFLRRMSARPAAPVKRGVPTVRTAAAGERREGNIIEQMSDAQFRAFSQRAMEATLAGRRVRLD